MSTPAPQLESFCFPGYHLGFRKHSFMVAGLLPAGPMVINQGQCRPQSLQQTLCAAAAGGLDGCFQGFKDFFIYFWLFCSFSRQPTVAYKMIVILQLEPKSKI